MNSEALCRCKPHEVPMNSCRTRTWIHPLAFVLMGVLVAPTNLAACSVYRSPLIPSPRESVFWGTFTDQLILATAYPTGRSKEFVEHDSVTHGLGHWAQLVEVVDHSGPGSRWLARNTVSRRVAVVLWGYDAACRPIPVIGRKLWGVPGDAVYFAAQARPRNLWLGGMLTYDLYFGGLSMYYPSQLEAEWKLGAAASGVGPYADLLSARQGFELIQSLPSLCDYDRAPSDARQLLTDTQGRWSHARSTYPVDEVFEIHRNVASGAERASDYGC